MEKVENRENMIINLFDDKNIASVIQKSKKFNKEISVLNVEYEKNKIIKFENVKGKNIIIDLYEVIDYIVLNFRYYVEKRYIRILKIEIKRYIYKKYGRINEEYLSSLIDSIIFKMFGYDFLQKYILDKNIAEILVDDYDNIWIKEHGKWKKALEAFKSKDEYINYINYCVLKNGGGNFVSKANYKKEVIDKKLKITISVSIDKNGDCKLNILKKK